MAQALPEPTYETDWVTTAEKEDPVNGNRVTFMEWHPQHPGTETLIAPGHVKLVALTPSVIAALRLGQLVLADAPAQVFAETPWAAVPPPKAPTYPAVPQATARRHKTPEVKLPEGTAVTGPDEPSGSKKG